MYHPQKNEREKEYKGKKTYLLGHQRARELKQVHVHVQVYVGTYMHMYVRRLVHTSIFLGLSYTPLHISMSLV